MFVLRVGDSCHDDSAKSYYLQVLIQKMPHIIPHTERVLLFKKYVANNKAKLGLSDAACASPHSTLITVHRWGDDKTVHILDTL